MMGISNSLDCAASLGRVFAHFLVRAKFHDFHAFISHAFGRRNYVQNGHAPVAHRLGKAIRTYANPHVDHPPFFFLHVQSQKARHQLVGAPFWCAFIVTRKPRRFNWFMKKLFVALPNPIFIPVCFCVAFFRLSKRPIQRSLWSKPPAQNFARLSCAGRNSPSPSINTII